jgi:hypothetical protein
MLSPKLALLLYVSEGTLAAISDTKCDKNMECIAKRRVEHHERDAIQVRCALD